MKIHMFKLFFLVLVNIIFGLQIASAEISRLRVGALMGANANMEDEYDTFESTGVNITYITSFGLGIGYTSISSTLKASSSTAYDEFQLDIDEEAVLNEGYLDVSYTLGDSFSFTIGVGVMVNGSATDKLSVEGEYTDPDTQSFMLENRAAVLEADPSFSGLYTMIDGYSVNLDSSSSSGTSLFLGIGYALDSIELFLNYRINSMEHKFSVDDLEAASGLTFDSEYAKVAGSYSILNAGIGFVF